jgi:hypothetical protein
MRTGSQKEGGKLTAGQGPLHSSKGRKVRRFKNHHTGITDFSQKSADPAFLHPLFLIEQRHFNNTY